MNMNCTGLSLVLLLYGTAFSGSVPLTEFLNTAADDDAVRKQLTRRTVVEESGTAIPWIDDVEVRVRNQAFAVNRQRYTLRVEPKGFGETSAEKAVNGSLNALHAHRIRLLTNKALLTRYRTALNLQERQELAALDNRIKALYEDRITVLQNRSDSPDFKLDDLIAAEDELTSLTFGLQEQHQRIALLQEEIGRYLAADGAFTAFDVTDMVTLPYIRQCTADSTFTLDSNNVYLEYERLQFAHAENRYGLEKTEDRRYISFLEYSYDHGQRLDELERWEEGKDDYDVNEAHILEMGVRLPFFNTNRYAIGRRKAAYLTDLENYERKKLELTDRIKKDSDDLRILFGQYEYLKARENDVNAEASLKRYLQMEGIDPLILLTINESILENTGKMIRIKYDIYRSYLRLMDSTGRVTQEPLVNILSSGRDKLGI